jgi:S-formylglutathione hydrolase FrmB
MHGATVPWAREAGVVHGLRRRFLIGLLAAALIGAAAATASLLHDSRDVELPSAALAGPGHARVILPAGYADNPATRYPVVYFLHGLPGSSSSYRGNTWVADAIADAGPAILVYAQGARDDDTDPEYLDWGSGRNWGTYVSSELVRYVDAHFRTIASRAGRAIVGVSAGGYGATIIGLHNLARFSVIESWSGYFHPTDATGTRPLAAGGPAANAHTLVTELHSRPTFFAFYVGRGDLRFRAENVQLARELTATHVPHVFDLYPGAHQTTLWQRHAVAWLRLALAHLQRPADH